MSTKAPAGLSVAEHSNAIVLIGELAAPPEQRVLPSGDEVVTFRMTVRSPLTTPRRTGPASEEGVSRKPATALASDSIDCAVWTPRLRARVIGFAPGELLQVTGSLRHRYWRGAGGLASRYEVEVSQLRTGRAIRSPADDPS